MSGINPWQDLGIDPTRDVDAINRAYTRKCETIPPNADKAIALRKLAQARDQALNWQVPLPITPKVWAPKTSFPAAAPSKKGGSRRWIYLTIMGLTLTHTIGHIYRSYENSAIQQREILAEMQAGLTVQIQQAEKALQLSGGDAAATSALIAQMQQEEQELNEPAGTQTFAEQWLKLRFEKSCFDILQATAYRVPPIAAAENQDLVARAKRLSADPARRGQVMGAMQDYDDYVATASNVDSQQLEAARKVAEDKLNQLEAPPATTPPQPG